MILSLIFGLGINIINTRLLGPEQYGNLKFIQSLFNFIIPFLSLGFFTSGARLVAQKENENIKSHLIGGLTIWAAAISLFMIIGFYLFSYFQSSIFHNNLNITIRMFTPFLFIFPFTVFLEETMYGDNRIFSLSFFKFLPLLLYIFGTLLYHSRYTFTIRAAMTIQFSILAITVIFFTLLFKPKFKDLSKVFRIIKKENSDYGFHVYIGSLAGVATVQLAGLSIGFFKGNLNVGYYYLALTSALPLTMIPQVVGITFFKDFTCRNSIPGKLTLLTVIITSVALIIYLLLIKRLFILLYSVKYITAVPLAYIFAFSCSIHGFGDYINKFLGAHGKGKELRNAAFVVGFINILGYIILVKQLGIIGAAITAIIADCAYFLIMLSYYVQIKKLYAAKA